MASARDRIIILRLFAVDGTLRLSRHRADSE